MIDHVGVVILARDEAAPIGLCLDSVVIAAAATDSRVTIVVVVADYSDDTAAVARRYDDVIVQEASGASTGVARAAGSRRALRAGCSWLAHTDADSVVPVNWVTEQVRLAGLGHDVVMGTVRPAVDDLSPAKVSQWFATHERSTPMGYVEGANFGVRSSTYLAVGGFHSLEEHEDNELVGRLRSMNARIIASDTAEVMTSGRLRVALTTATPDTCGPSVTD